jgi:uncharacterized integral membrane protein
MEGTPTPVSSGRGPKFWVMLVAILLGIIFVAANFEDTEINFIVAKAEAPLVIALLITGALGFVIGLALPRFRRPHD